ncbi:MAG: hypothetical protein NT038_04015 [Euryarchaeota archaeon]|nr:hypothetical protein [Euryarchaeota archaeon]
MKRKIWVIGGSIGAGVILILVAFTAIVNAQATKDVNRTTNNFLYKKLDVGSFLDILLSIILGLFYWWSITHPPS